MTSNGLTPDSVTSLFCFRVLLRFDTKYEVYVAHCLETGNVVTSDSPEEAEEMMKELLEDELLFALRNRNLKNLYSSPAPLEVRMQWAEAAMNKRPKTVDLDVDFSQLEHSQIEPHNARFTNTVEVALAA